MKINTALLLVISIVLFICGCISHQLEGQLDENADNFIDYLFKDYEGNRPGASVILIQNGKVAFSKSYGMADIENHFLATPTTNYRIASVTKQFTAMAIMTLINEGKLSYDTKLTEIFPEFPNYGDSISVRHLLIHRSGLVKYNRFLKEGQTAQLLDKDVLQGLLETDSTYFPPNSDYAYSNTGYAVLSQVIERVSGMSFSDYLSEEIFQPLDMKHSIVYEKGKPISERAFGYIIKDSSIVAKDQSLTSAIQGDGGIYSSVVDFYKWDQALYSDQLLPKSEIEKAFYHYDENGRSLENGYGYGWKISYENGIKILQHGGSSTGFGSHVIRIPSENVAVAIFTNRNKRGKELAKKAKAIINYCSEGILKMPFEVEIEKEIDLKGIDAGMKRLENIKQDTAHYSISKEGLFNFGIFNINSKKEDIAFKVFDFLKRNYPSYFGGYYGCAIIYEKQGEYEKALNHFNLTIAQCEEQNHWARVHSSEMKATISNYHSNDSE